MLSCSYCKQATSQQAATEARQRLMHRTSVFKVFFMALQEVKQRTIDSNIKQKKV
jgi:hypothetical protein